MKLEHYTNNGYDSVVLVNNDGAIVGAWAGVNNAVADFYAAENGDPSDWGANGDDWRPDAEMDTLVATIEADGTLVAADAELMASRRDFWGIADV